MAASSRCPKCYSAHVKYQYGGERGEAGPFLVCFNCDYNEEESIYQPLYLINNDCILIYDWRRGIISLSGNQYQKMILDRKTDESSS